MTTDTETFQPDPARTHDDTTKWDALMMAARALRVGRSDEADAWMRLADRLP